MLSEFKLSKGLLPLPKDRGRVTKERMNHLESSGSKVLGEPREVTV